METTHSLPSGLLAKVRALLAKAESTSFEAEADAFTAKAQELMTRYRIDQALLDADGQRAAGPVTRPVRTENPYADVKAVLLSKIAQANGCSVVWSKFEGVATVFGFFDELEAVEALFTSLLVQAVGALQREGSKQDGLGRSRTASFRRAFLLAFAVRIGQRLHQAVDDTVAAASAETSAALVPLLERRADASRAASAAAFPVTRPLRTSASDPAGWAAGTRFGDQADLGVRRGVSRRSA